jgi:hypothetical protein
MVHSSFIEQIPAHILASPFLQKGGFDVFEGLTSSALQSKLLAEALEHYSLAEVNLVTEPDHENFRGGKPPRCFSSAPGGPVQALFYHSPQVLELLSQLTGVYLRPTGENGTYSYYLRAGDHLALHRDIKTCDLTVITCLHCRSNSKDFGGMLYLYPQYLFEPLSTLRKNLSEGAVGLSLKAGQSLVFFGGIVPHFLSHLALGQERIVSVLCYAA